MERIVADETGGVYFLTLRSTRDKIIQTQHGFAYKPNGLRSPFGNGGRRYVVTHLFGDWHEFSDSMGWAW